MIFTLKMLAATFLLLTVCGCTADAEPPTPKPTSTGYVLPQSTTLTEVEAFQVKGYDAGTRWGLMILNARGRPPLRSECVESSYLSPDSDSLPGPSSEEEADLWQEPFVTGCMTIGEAL